MSQAQTTANSSVSLTINYLPNKFSNPSLASAGARRRNHMAIRKGQRDASPGEGIMPKMGGGVEAFRSGEARIGGPGDEDDEMEVEDGSGSRWFKRRTRKKGHKKLRWNKFKWAIFCTNLILTIYCFVTLILCLLTWFNVWEHADIIRVGNRPELVVSTLACCLGIFTSLIGWAGILLNNRSFLAVYTFSLWIVFIFMLIPGYLTYKQRTFNLEGKINAQWSQRLGAEGRMRIQNELQCCGYFSPYVEATVTQTCYARSILPGCKLKYIVFQRRVLQKWYTVVFALVPVHVMVMVAGLLCSNHVTYRFGKGMMPKAYRLSMASMAIIMENYASQLADRYGMEVASDILTRSRSNLQLDALPSLPHTGNDMVRPPSVYLSAKYDAVDTRPESSAESTSRLL
ncbi:hypothetical protein M413DRAFT_448751 [Hebeloma cylindrosporum]|uniref:Tetraspanin Tsp2 family n=1 Tax=Hebeloma cylindrosporum TaxID=76867 RepID=A0A0C3C002_HEBCY|nr:hypothetical protein M413DRAFT_448751 [Hebeloma cylindrosporum h7]